MKILGLRGKKQSGKNTFCNFMFGMELISGVWSHKGQLIDITDFEINNDGKLIVPMEDNEIISHKILDIECPGESLTEFLSANIWPFVKNYSFAAKLKEVAIDLFGLEYKQCFGSDNDKNTFTQYKWSELPEYIKQKIPEYFDLSKLKENITARQFLQLLGTNVFRAMKDDIWVEYCIKTILKEQPELAIISDVRFNNEARAIQQAGGKVIKLTRQISSDTHASETEVDDTTPDFLLDNQNMTISEQNHAILAKLKEWNYLPFPMSERVIC